VPRRHRDTGPLTAALDSPLVLCAARTFTDADLIASDVVYPHGRDVAGWIQARA
jgi:hypothetical protein